MLSSLFDLLQADGPVLADFPEQISDTAAEPLMCAIPPRHDEGVHPAVAEARAIGNAYERAVAEYGNRIGVSREIEATQVADAITAFVKIVEGADWKEAGIPGNPMRVAQDVRGYYQTAALVLADHSPGAWAGENWFYQQTETGRLMLKLRSVLKAAGAPQPLWFYLSPGDRPV